MNSKIDNFVKAFLTLNNSERKQVIEIVKELEGAVGRINENRIVKSFGIEGIESLGHTINFAPTPGRCPACGK